MKAIKLISLIVVGLSLVRCSGGGGEEPAATTQSAQGPTTPTTPPAPRNLPGAPATAFLAATSEGLWRGDTTGKGGVVFQASNLNRQTRISVSDGRIYYGRIQPFHPEGFDHEDIWAVNADGTGNRALVATPDFDFLRLASGPWVLYSTDDLARSLRVDTGQQSVLSEDRSDYIEVLVGSKVVMSNSRIGQISSVNLDGTDARIHTENSYNVTGINAAEPNAFVYGQWQNSSARNRLFSVSFSGGPPIPLEDGSRYSFYASHSGERVVFARCTVIDTGDIRTVGACDVSSVNLDGTQTAVLAQQPENEAVQGIVGDKVIIRRNVSGNDQLVFVPITGGAESFITMLTDNDFVETVAGDSLVLSRSTGTWRLDLNGTLTKLGPTAGGNAYQVVGNAVCYNVNFALYCAPLDGSGPEVRIDRNGRIVGVL